MEYKNLLNFAYLAEALMGDSTLTHHKDETLLDKEDVLKRMNQRKQKPKPIKNGHKLFCFDANLNLCDEAHAVHKVYALNEKSARKKIVKLILK